MDFKTFPLLFTTAILTVSEGFSILGDADAVGSEGLAVAVADGVGEAEGFEATVGVAVGVADTVALEVVEVGVLDVQETPAPERLTAIARLHKKYFFIKISLNV
ncbi:hypothetical protein APA_407 [Pseudanabaena sp. lw0831]|uniref:hypothetical protein n=1 Tax=Pseudanabaena sp. lw0831 TaxID=1357935 RepID=UPI001915E5B9|nr:hypothetical protein [Pseudanabaena sp. lw0831]GBO52738.1 hypothetical protein APA_407 [Pseudanabaena sp. lw0831]